MDEGPVRVQTPTVCRKHGKINCSMCQAGTHDTELKKNVQRNAPEEMTFKPISEGPESLPDRAGEKQKAAHTKARDVQTVCRTAAHLKWTACAMNTSTVSQGWRDDSGGKCAHCHAFIRPLGATDGREN